MSDSVELVLFYGPPFIVSIFFIFVVFNQFIIPHALATCVLFFVSQLVYCTNINRNFILIGQNLALLQSLLKHPYQNISI